MFTGARWGNIGDCRQSTIFKVYKIFTKINNVTGEFWIIEKTVYIEERYPNNLRSPVTADLGKRSIGNPGVIILYIEFPGNALFFETIKNRRHFIVTDI